MSDTHPLAPMLALGASDVYTQPWPDYVSWLNLTEEHVPDLLRIILDTPWENRDWDNEPDAWAPIHAWRAIAQLRSQAAIQPLIRLIDRSVDNEWVWSEIPYVYAMIGPAGVFPLSTYIAENGQKFATAYTAISALSQIAQYYPETAKPITTLLSDRLAKAQENHPAVNGYLTRALIELDAEEHVPIIREAYEEGLVDESVSGEWYDVLVEFGLADPLDGSPPRRRSEDETPRGQGAGSNNNNTRPQPTRPQMSKKDKNKKKQAKKDRKENRKRR